MSDDVDPMIDLYSRRAVEWDADRGKALMERSWLDAFLAETPSDGALLDLGCGSGEPVARYLIERGRRVTGVDASPGMIDLCRARFPDHDWRVADMRGLDLGRTFDGVLAWHSAFHLKPEDQAEMFDIYARHLAPGGALMFTSGPDAGEATGDWRGEVFRHYSLSPEAYRAAMDAADLDILRHQVEDPDCGGATIWLGRRRVR